MAFTFTSRGTGYTAYNSTLDSPSFTPTANSVLIVAVLGTTANRPVDSVSGHGTWTELTDSPLVIPNNFDGCVWACVTGSSPSADVVTADWTGNNAAALAVIEISGDIDATSVANAIVQQKGTSQYNSGGSPYTLTVTMDSSVTSGNCTVLAVFPKDSTNTVKTGWTSSVFESTVGVGFHYIAAGEQSGEVSSATSFTGSGGIMIELAASSGDSSTILPHMMQHYL